MYQTEWKQEYNNQNLCDIAKAVLQRDLEALNANSEEEKSLKSINSYLKNLENEGYKTTASRRK